MITKSITEALLITFRIILLVIKILISDKKVDSIKPVIANDGSSSFHIIFKYAFFI